MNIFMSNRTLHRNRMIEIDGSRSGMGIQIEGRILWKTQLHTSRTRMKMPLTGGFAIRPNAAASGLGLKGAANIP